MIITLDSVHSEYNYGERDCLRVDLGGACGFIGRGCGLHGMQSYIHSRDVEVKPGVHSGAKGHVFH